MSKKRKMAPNIRLQIQGTFKSISFVSQLISYCCFVFYYICGEQQLHIRILKQVCYAFGIIRLFCHYWIELECCSSTNRARNLQRLALKYNFCQISSNGVRFKENKISPTDFLSCIVSVQHL